MSKRILILEPNQQLAQVLERVFEINEYAVTCAASFEEAVASFEWGSFECVLMNLHGGRELMDRMMSFMSAALPRMPRVVLISAPGEGLSWRGEDLPSVFLPAPDSFEKLFRAFEGRP